MDIDLTLLHSQTVKEVDITNSYTIPSNYFENTSVLKIEDINVEGKVYMNESEDDEEELTDYIEASIKGDIILSDSISLEPVSYPVSIEINDILDQNCKKNENTLDIFQFLWENIVLEVPLQFTKVKDLSKFHGDGWKLISEEELVSNNNPFSDLLKDFKLNIELKNELSSNAIISKTRDTLIRYLYKELFLKISTMVLFKMSSFFIFSLFLVNDLS